MTFNRMQRPVRTRRTDVHRIEDTPLLKKESTIFIF